MIVLFHLLFLVGLGKRFYAKHKNDFIIRALESMFVSKEGPNTMSVARKTASRTMLVPYKFQGEEYELVLPVRRKKLIWDVCIAIIGDVEKDVTDQVKKMAGPYGDFYGAHKNDLKAHQIIRNASSLKFFSKDREILIIK